MSYIRKKILATNVSEFLDTFAEIGFAPDSEDPKLLYFEDAPEQDWHIKLNDYETDGQIKSFELYNGSTNEKILLSNVASTNYIELYICELKNGVSFGIATSANSSAYTYAFPYTQIAIVYDAAVEDFVFLRKYDLTGNILIKVGNQNETKELSSFKGWRADGYFSFIRVPFNGVALQEVYYTACLPQFANDTDAVEVILDGKNYIIYGSSIGYGKNYGKIVLELKNN